MSASRRRAPARIAGAAVVMLALWASAAPTLIYPLYISAWHLSTLETTVAFATYPAAMILALLVLGNLSDIVGGRRAMLAGLVLLGSGALALAVAPGLGALVAGRALMGLGVGASLGAATVEAGRSPERERGLAGRGDDGGPGRRGHGGAVVTVASSIGLVTALVLGGAAVQDWPRPRQLPFEVLVVAIVAVLVLVVRLPDDRPAAAPRWRFQPVVVPRPRRGFLAGALAISAAYCLGAVYLGVGAQYARDVVGSTDATVTGLVLAASAVAIGAVAIVARDVNPRSALIGGAVAVVCGQTLMIASGDVRQLWMLVGASAVGGAGYGLLFSAGISTVIAAGPPHHRAAATSTAYLFAYGMQADGALAVGAISTAHTLPAGLAAGSAAVLLLVVLALVLHAAPHSARVVQTVPDGGVG